MLIPAGLIYLGLAKLMNMLVIEDYSQVQASGQSQANVLKPSESESPQGCGPSGSKAGQSDALLVEQKEQARQRPGSGGAWRQIIGDKHFLACLVIVLLAAGTLEASINILKIHLVKRPAELREPLASLPAELGNFEAVSFKDPNTGEMEIDRVLPEDFVHALGTETYLSRSYLDPQTAEGLTPLVEVFSTYYTGKPELVPHVPERCQAAAGYSQTGSEIFEVEIPELGLPGDKLTLRASTFAGTDTRTGQARSFAIIYFFVANGEYLDDWKRVRWHLNAPQAYFWDKYSYYGFFRLTFPKSNDKGQCIATAKKFLKLAVPEMIRIWPDLEELSKRP